MFHVGYVQNLYIFPSCLRAAARIRWRRSFAPILCPCFDSHIEFNYCKEATESFKFLSFCDNRIHCYNKDNCKSTQNVKKNKKKIKK